MTGSQYNNIIQGTLGDIGLEHADDSAYVAKKIFDNCGVAFPTGNSGAVLAVLQSNDYVGWRSCTAEAAQENANEGVATVAISNDCITVIRPEERAVLVKSAFINPMANYDLASTADEVSVDDDEGVAYFAYSAARTTTNPEVFSSVNQKCSLLNAYQMDCNAKYIYKFLTFNGFTPHAACGVLGNMETESGIDPGVWQYMNDLNYGYGLLQWDDATKFTDWALKTGYILKNTPAEDITDRKIAGAVNTMLPKELMDAQLIFLVYNTPSTEFYAPASKDQHSGYRMNYSTYKANKTLSAYTLAMVFHDHHQRSQDTLTMIKENRCDPAQRWFSAFYNKI